MSAENKKGVGFRVSGVGSDKALAYLLVAPTVFVLLALSIYPLIHAVNSVCKLTSGWSTRWSLRILRGFVSDQFFLAALGHTLVYRRRRPHARISSGPGSGCAAQKTNPRARVFFVRHCCVPMMLPTVVVGVVWRLMLNPNFGAVNGR